MRLVRYLLFIVVITAFIAASVVTVVSGGQNIPVLVAAGFLAIISLPQTTEWVWDKVGPAKGLRTNSTQPTAPGTEEGYLNGRLKAFADEEKRFVPLALTLKPAYQEAEAEPTDDIDAIFRQQKGRFVLIGDPGAGKSTTLRHLMRRAIAHYRQDPIAHRLPVWINLGEGANPIQPDELLQFWWNKRCFLPGAPEQYIRQHNLLLFLDGLNEMSLDSRSERAASLRTFLEQNPEVQAVVCCRVRDYEDDEALNLNLPVVRVLPLDDGRVQDFIVRNGGESSLWDTVRADEALRAMAANPYNLYQLIKVSTEAGGHDLPRDLNQLYKRYLKVTYDRYTVDRENQRDKETSLLKLPLPKLEKRLQQLAFAMLAEGKGTSAELEWALHWRRRWRWGQQAIKDGINLGVLIGDGSNLRFYHQSLHGYFAIEPLSKALTVGGGFDRFTKNPVALIRQIGDLGAAGSPAVESLIAILCDPDIWVSTNISIALAEIGDKRAVEPLIVLLNDVNAHIDARRFAGMALGVIGDRRAVEPLVNVLRHEDISFRSSAAEALVKIGEASVEPLINALRDIDTFIRQSAAEALVKIGEASVEPLINALRDTDAFVRRRAAESLGNFGSTRAVEPLINALRDTDAFVRRRAAESLGNLGSTRAVDPLIAALDDEYVRYRGTKALEQIGTPEAIAAVKAWRKEQKRKNSNSSPLPPSVPPNTA